MVTVRSILADMRNAFRAAGLDTPELDARLLVEAALRLDQADLLTKADQEITKSQEESLEAMTLRRLQREPVSRILGTRAFWKSDFKISSATLDPRPDSETLIEAVLKQADKTAPLRILDLGTGTGCLLLSLLQELPLATGTGIDISTDAVKIALQNAESLCLTDRSDFMVTSWSEMPILAPYDIVISNPPYITLAEIEALEPEVRAYDPITALSGGIDGLDCYRDITALLPRLLKPEGMVFFEIGSTQAESVKGIVGKAGLTMLHTITDLAGHDRCLVARYNNKS